MPRKIHSSRTTGGRYLKMPFTKTKPLHSGGVSFQEAVEATYWLLMTVGENHWASHFARHKNGDREGFRSVYGGMGSLNDLIICKRNGHVLNENHEAISNGLFDLLRSISSVASLTGSADGNDIVAQCIADKKLSGWRCRECGYAQISKQAVARFQAGHLINRMVRDGSFFNGALLTAVQNIWENFSSDKAVNELRDAVAEAEISLQEDGDFWQRPCPKCGSNNRCMYHWDWLDGAFISSKGNLTYKRNGKRVL